MTGQILVGGPGHGMPVPAGFNAPLWVPEKRDVWRVTDVPAVYVPRRYWSAWPIPGWELRLSEEVTRHPNGTDAVWTVRAWAQEFHHAEITAFIDSDWGYEIDAVLKGYLWRDDDLIDTMLPRALAAAQTLAEMTGTVPTEQRVSYSSGLVIR